MQPCPYCGHTTLFTPLDPNFPTFGTTVQEGVTRMVGCCNPMCETNDWADDDEDDDDD